MKDTPMRRGVADSAAFQSARSCPAAWFLIGSMASCFAPAIRVSRAIDGPRCIRKLRGLRRELSDGSSDFIFPGDKPGRPSIEHGLSCVAASHGKTGMTPHGFRSSFRDWAEEKTNHSQRTIETKLAHVVKDKTEGRVSENATVREKKRIDGAVGTICNRRTSEESSFNPR